MANLSHNLEMARPSYRPHYEEPEQEPVYCACCAQGCPDNDEPVLVKATILGGTPVCDWRCHRHMEHVT